MKTKIILLFSLLFFLQGFTQEKVIKYSKAKIYYSNTLDLTKMLNNGIAVDHGKNKRNVFVESVFSSEEINNANILGFHVEILIDDMQKYIQNRKKTASLRNASCPTSENAKVYNTPNNFELGSMGGFYTYTQMLQELDDMHSLYPNLISAKAQISNFLTYENRPIYSIKISDNPDVDESEPEMLFTAIHHAREPASMQQLIFYMWYLLENYATDDEIKGIVDNTEQYFIPVLNVDGYIYNETTNPNGGGFWRKNRRLNNDGSIGVDNNRNYSYHWGESGVSSSGSGETWPGEYAFSEIENQAVKWFCEQHNFVMALNNHTYSQLLLYPFGYASNTPTPEDNLFETISSLMVSQNGYTNQISADLYPAAGDSDDWMYGDTSTKSKIYAMTPEIGNDFWPNESDIIGICKDMMFHNITAAHLITNYAEITDLSPQFIPSLTGNFDYQIKRLGLQDPANFSVSMVPISSNIISVGGSQSHNGLSMLQEVSGAISYQLASSTQVGEEIKYKLIVANGQFNTEQIISKVYGSSLNLYNDSCDNTSNYNNSDWEVTTSDYYSASSAITDSANGDYNNNTNSTIELTNEIDLSNVTDASLSFYTKWSIEAGWDYVQFEISIDNGNTWIPQCGNYTSAGVANQNIEGEPMYDGNQSSWIKEEISLSDYIGESIRFRFQIVSDNYQTEDGFYFDDFKVEVINPSSTAGVNNTELNNVIVYPNPFEDNFSVKIPNIYNEVTIALFTINGKLITQKKTTNSLTKINLNNLSNGVYFIRITTNDNVKTLKVIKQ
jgi:murein tripeptide amidase MpaA